LFPIAEYWWAYLAFTAFVAVLLALDLGVFNRTPRAISIPDAAKATIGWFLLALAFNYVFYLWAATRLPMAQAHEAALQFAAGYLVERALSFDNIFIFVVVFNYFSIPPVYQHRVLFYGIVGAFAFRAIFVALGAVLMRYHAVVMFFGVLLLYTGAKMALGMGNEKIEPERNPVIRLLRRWMPVTAEIDGERFFKRIGGVRHATPLFIALVFLELTDIVFAIDSVPAIFALTDEPLIVFSSNILAILGLRAMYFLLAGAMDKFHLLKYGLALVLIFVGLKMVWFNGVYAPHVPIGWSLGIIGSTLAIFVALSLAMPDRGTMKAEGPE